MLLAKANAAVRGKLHFGSISLESFVDEELFIVVVIAVVVLVLRVAKFIL
jgi:hypothetical protein